MRLDDVIAELFREYPNGLTPDPRTVHHFLERYAHKSQGKWKIDPEMVIAATLHTDIISVILKLGGKLRAQRFVGRREQPERTSNNVILRDLADLKSLASLRASLGAGGVERLQMVDAVFLEARGDELLCLWEVENSTSFGAAIYRGSNAPANVPKFMVIPEERETELLKYKDPLFVQSFGSNGWLYLTYADVTRLAGYSTLTLEEILSTAKRLGDADGIQNGN